jgi:hypothetical protein
MVPKVSTTIQDARESIRRQSFRMCCIVGLEGSLCQSVNKPNEQHQFTPRVIQQ